MEAEGFVLFNSFLIWWSLDTHVLAKGFHASMDGEAMLPFPCLREPFARNYFSLEVFYPVIIFLPLPLLWIGLNLWERPRDSWITDPFYLTAATRNGNKKSLFTLPHFCTWNEVQQRHHAHPVPQAGFGPRGLLLGQICGASSSSSRSWRWVTAQV